MPTCRRFMSRRRLLAYFGLTALVFGLLMLHPYPRQSLFGPTIRGKPRCFWEAEVRYHVHKAKHEDTLSECALLWIGIEREELGFAELFGHPHMAPLLAQLLDDSDAEVRFAALNAFGLFPALQKSLDDADPEIRNHAVGRLRRLDYGSFQHLKAERKIE